MYFSFINAPVYHLIFEAFLALWIIRLLFIRSYKLKKHDSGPSNLTEKEKEDLIKEWIPEPLVPQNLDNNQDCNLIEGFSCEFIKIRLNLGNDNVKDSCFLLDLGSYNFLNLADSSVGQEINKYGSQINEETIKALKIYGVGACGPRGFYGTIDVHLKLELELADFFVNMTTVSSEALSNKKHDFECCIYSYGFATISSIIPAFSKRGDIIFVDEACNFAIQRGLQASRSVIKMFRHNDIAHLKRLLDIQATAEAKDPAKARVTKKFIVVEGIYQNTGNICPLIDIVPFRQQYKVRIFVEESLSFGVIGNTGHGITEYYDIDIGDVDLIIGSLENSLGSIGGFCVGKKYIIENNYLSGLGYCFSASLPPLQAQAALTALHIIQENPNFFSKLCANSNLFFDEMQSKIRFFAEKFKSKGFELALTGTRDSPLSFFKIMVVPQDNNVKKAIANNINEKFEMVAKSLQTINIDRKAPVDFIGDGILVVVPKYLTKEEMSLGDDHHLIHGGTIKSHSMHAKFDFGPPTIFPNIPTTSSPLLGPSLKFCIKRLVSREQIVLSVNLIWEQIQKIFLDS